MPILCRLAYGVRGIYGGADFGKDEVSPPPAANRGGGRGARRALWSPRGQPVAASVVSLESVLPRAYPDKTVPYKPPGNKAYSTAVKERFRPFVAELPCLNTGEAVTAVTILAGSVSVVRSVCRISGEVHRVWEREDRMSQRSRALQKKRL